MNNSVVKTRQLDKTYTQGAISVAARQGGGPGNQPR